MAETRSQTPLKIVMTDETREIVLSLLVKMKETYDDYFAQVEDIYAKFYSESHATRLSCRSRDRKEENPEDQICIDEELTEIEAETKSSGIEDRAVENEANSKVISAIVKEESIPQILMVTEADSTCVQQQVSISPLEHSLNFCKANLDAMGNCQYAMRKTHQIWSDSNFGCVNDDACQVFDVIHMRTKVLPREHKKRFHKSWRFKFKDKVQPSKLIQEQLGVHKGNATRNQLGSPSGFVVDASHSGFGSDIWCVQYLVGSVVVEDFQETQWLFNDELKDNQIFQIFIEEGSNSSAYQKFNGMCIGSWLKAPYVKLETECLLEIESLQEDVQLVLLAFLHVNASEPRYAIGERDEMLEVARDVSKKSMLGLTFGIRESNAGEDQRAVCEQIIKVNVWLYQIRLVLQQVMRSKKIKFPKRWMFKYKYGKEGIQRLQIQLRYKSWLEFDHWLGYNLIVAYLGNKKTWTKLRVREHDNLTWKEDVRDESRSRSRMKLGDAMITCKNLLEKGYDTNVEIVAWSMRPGHSEISCEVDAFGDQESSKIQTRGKLEQFGGLCKELTDIDVSLASFYVQLRQTSFVVHQVRRNKKIKPSKRWWFKYKSHYYSFCQESFAYQITSFSTNLEVKVSLKGEDLLQELDQGGLPSDRRLWASQAH